jgi:hypothetical protein
VWSDDFDDGDYDGWIIAEGMFLVEEGALKAVSSMSTAFLPSAIAVGTWSFAVKF